VAGKNSSAADPGFLPTSFYFEVKFEGKSKIDDVAFKEVSGLSLEVEYESIVEGGASDRPLMLPRPAKHGNLVLKRAVLPAGHTLIQWVKNAMGSSYVQPIAPCNITVRLMKENDKPLYVWSCTRAYPVKWSTEGFESEKNAVALETIELAYAELIRML
jgi:phage tail-like protein